MYNYRLFIFYIVLHALTYTRTYPNTFMCTRVTGVETRHKVLMRQHSYVYIKSEIAFRFFVYRIICLKLETKLFLQVRGQLHMPLVPSVIA